MDSDISRMDFCGLEREVDQLAKKVGGIDKKLDFVMQAIKLTGIQKTPAGDIRVQMTLADAYKEATYHATPVVGAAPHPHTDSSHSGGHQKSPDPEEPDPAEEAAARARLQALRAELKRA